VVRPWDGGDGRLAGAVPERSRAVRRLTSKALQQGCRAYVGRHSLISRVWMEPATSSRGPIRQLFASVVAGDDGRGVLAHPLRRRGRSPASVRRRTRSLLWHPTVRDLWVREVGDENRLSRLNRDLLTPPHVSSEPLVLSPRPVPSSPDLLLAMKRRS
jgi:hypothetical protein